MYRIGEFSELTGLSVKTLRFYDELGILKPGYIDEFTNYRYYTEDNYNQALVINDLKRCHFKLEEIKYILDNGLNKDIIENKQSEIKTEIDELYDSYNRLDVLNETLSFAEYKSRSDVKVRRKMKKAA